MRKLCHRWSRGEPAAFAASLAIVCVVGSSGCSSDSSGANHQDGGDESTATAGGSSNAGKANAGANSGASASNASGGTANAASGGTANGGTTNGGASNGGTANGGRTNSAGANSGGRSTASGGASNAGANSGGANDSGARDSGAPMLIDQYVTFYGWPDNDPAGNGIAYPGLHKGASGTGTYADPITFATDPKEWKPGTILYLPYLKRYVIMEDSCAECITDWKTGKYHIDIWLESNGSFDSQVLACENTLTREKTSVEVDPPPDRPVDATPLFDTKSGKCNPPQ